MRSLLVIVAIVTSGWAVGQVADTVVVDFTKSAYLVFGSSEVKYDCGSEDVIVRKSENKLILQAGVENFEETNLFVEADGRIYVFIVVYGDPKGKFLYNYANLKVVGNGNKSDQSSNESKGEVLEVNTEREDSLLQDYKDYCESMLFEEDRITNRGIVKYKLGIYLRDIKYHKEKMFLEFEVVNKSNIPYYVDFYQYRVKSVKRKVKGESFQEIEMTPFMEYKRPEKFEGKSTTRYVIVMDKFVLTENKKLVVEHWEDNGRDLNIEGGRKVDFDVLSRDIINAKI